MDGSAQLVPLAPGYIQVGTHTEAHVVAILAPARRTVVAGRDDCIIPDNDGTEFAPQAGAALRDGLGNVKVVIVL